MRALTTVLLGALIFTAAEAATPIDYVNALMGTQSSFELSAGNTYPAITLPWGMNAWTPQTTPSHRDGWIYTYDSHKFYGLRQTHQPSPWMGDYGQWLVMPFIQDTITADSGRLRPSSWYGHKAETVRPNYYGVYLADYDIHAELTPSSRGAVMRFTFPSCPDASAALLIDAFEGGTITDIDTKRHRIMGRSTSNSGGVPDGWANYFVVQFDRPWFMASTADSLRQAVATFATGRGDNVTACVASSFISPEQAILNLDEVQGHTFDDIRASGRKAWNDMLGRVEIPVVTADNLDEARTFYSCLYRALLFPRQWHEIDAQGRQLHRSPYDGEVHEGPMYTDTGFWDTFRALFPLLNLLYPEVNAQIQEGLLNTYRESGWLPEWASPGHRSCMIGNNSASVVADAYLNGICVADTATLWQAVTRGAHGVHPEVSSTGRLGWKLYDSLGFVPSDRGINESAARSLEYAYDDWCIWRLGLALGRDSAEIAPYAARASNYRNLYDSTNGLMRGRLSDSTWQHPYSPLKWGGEFTEGNAWHYTWSVFHDPLGLASLMGSTQTMAARLDSMLELAPAYDCSYYGFPIHEIREMTLMDMGNYAHGNQPVQHALYLYDWLGQPWKTQRHVRDVMRRFYTPTPDGYCGDEDNGQTSAWYVFSAMGMYPVAPATGQYALGSPLFNLLTLHIPGGRDLHIEAVNNSAANVYVQSVTFNGWPVDVNYLTREQLLQGGTLRFTMGPEPQYTRGNDLDAAPYSLSHDK